LDGHLDSPSQVVDARPHEVACHVVVRAHEPPQLLHVDHPAPAHAPEQAERTLGLVRDQGAVIPPHPAHGSALGPDDLPVGVRVPVDAVDLLCPVPPAVRVVVAHHVQQVQERLGRTPRLGSDLVAPHGHGARGVFPVEDLQEPPQGLDPVLGGLVPDLVARAPQHHRAVVPVPAHEVRHVPLGPRVEVEVVPMGADLALGHLPLVKGLVHDQESHAVAQVQELRGRGVVRGTYGVAPHVPEDLQAPLPHPLRHGRTHAARVVVQAHAVELHGPAVEQEAPVRVEDRLADPKGRVALIHHLVSHADPCAKGVQVRGLHGPEAGLPDRHLVDGLLVALG